MKGLSKRRALLEIGAPRLPTWWEEHREAVKNVTGGTCFILLIAALIYFS